MGAIRIQKMDVPQDKNARLNELLAKTDRKNREISRISEEADAALAPTFLASKANHDFVLSAAEREIAESTNALKLCTEKAISDMDGKLTERLYRLYRTLEGKNEDGEEERA